MSEFSNQKIGGEYGEIRANIDVAKLNEYLGKHVKTVKTPVTVKQFKVSKLKCQWEYAEVV